MSLESSQGAMLEALLGLLLLLVARKLDDG